MCIIFPITMRLLQNNERGFPLICRIKLWGFFMPPWSEFGGILLLFICHSVFLSETLTLPITFEWQVLGISYFTFVFLIALPFPWHQSCLPLWPLTWTYFTKKYLNRSRSGFTCNRDWFQSGHIGTNDWKDNETCFCVQVFKYQVSQFQSLHFHHDMSHYITSLLQTLWLYRRLTLNGMTLEMFAFTVSIIGAHVFQGSRCQWSFIL
jgi:hypothetical protein